jgi:hypothetical protein
VVAGWVLFRAESIRQALQVYLQMLGLSGPGVLPRSVAVPSVLIAASVMSLACVHHAVSKRRPRLAVSCWPLPLQGAAVVAALAASVFLRGPGSDFIYFQF